jgi:hypothetical protein
LDSSTGVISGTPLENGNFDVTVEIDTPPDAGGQTTFRSLNITINSPTNPRISSSVPGRLADASINVPVTYNTNFCCGSGPLTYSWTGATPAGLNLNLATGDILGTPTTPGRYRFIVTATDSADSSNIGAREFFLIVLPRRPDVVVNPASNKGNASVHGVSEPISVRNSVTASSGGPVSSAVKTPVSHALGNALNFVPITPCRVADTRNSTGPFGGPPIAGNSSRDFNIPSGTCGVPSTAQAYSLNVAVVPKGPLGYLTLWPTGQPQPFVSTLNSYDGRIKSNAAIVWAGTGGSISVFAADNATDLVLDINGYFVLATDPSGLAFYPVTPCRIADTRNAAGPLGGPSMGAGQSRTFPILSSACNLPATAQAYSLNFAAVPPGPLQYLTAWPTGKGQPFVATLNDRTGTVVGNAAIVPAGTNGSIDVFATDATDLVIDINGYFAPAGAGGLSLYGVAPCRVVDTRLPPGSPPITSLDVGVSSSGCGIPASAQAHVMSATVVPPGFMGFLTLWPQGQTRPNVATLNAYDGSVTSNMAIVPTTNGSISAFTSNPTHLVLDISGYFAATVAGPSIAVTNATVGANLEVQIGITFTPPPTSPITLTITSASPGAVLLGGAATPGSGQIQTTIEAGTSTVGTYVQAQTNSGKVMVTASAPGYTSGVGTVTLANSGFVVSGGPNGIGGTVNTFEGVQPPLTVFAARLDSTGLFVEKEGVTGGSTFNVPIASSMTTVGTVSPNLLSFTGGTSSLPVTFTASGTNTGSTSVMVTQPAGFTTPVVGGTLIVNVQKSGLFPPSGVVIGKNLQISTNVSITGNAPQDSLVTLTSLDTARLLFACPPASTACTPATGASSPSITVTIPQNSSQSAGFFMRGYDSAGSIGYTISSSNFGSVNATVPLAPSGFAIQTPGGGFGGFNMLTGQVATLNVYTAAFPAGSASVLEAVAGDQSVSATVTSDAPAIGTISSSPVVIAGGASFGSTMFNAVGVSPPSANVTASASGYTPAIVSVTVKNQTLSILNGLTVGQHLEVNGSVFLTSKAPAGGEAVTLTVDPASIGRLQLAVNPTDAGANSIIVTVPAGQQTGSYWIYGLGSSGTATYSANSPDYGPSPQPDTTTLAPSAIIIVGSQLGGASVSSGAGPQPLLVTTNRLTTDGQNTPQLNSAQSLAGNVPLTVNLGNTNSGAGTLSATSVNIAPGTTSNTLTFTPKATGNATISVTEPTGWTTPGLFVNFLGTFDLTKFTFQVQ